MGLVTIVWSMEAAAAATLAALCGLAWLGERRELGRLIFIVIAVGVAAGTRCEVGMMHAATAAEYAQWLRWYHLPVFVVIVGYVFLVRSYLGTGRLSLAWTIIAVRLAILISNFLVYPGFNWRTLGNLRHISFLGEQVSMPGDIVVRWQWVSTVSLLLMIVYVADACIQRLRKPQPDSRRRVGTVLFAIVVPMISVILLTQAALLGVAHIPLLATPWFLLTLATMAFELSREITMSRRAQQELTGLRGELVHVGRVTALGQLASALAHELMQPLSAILHNAEAAEVHLNAPCPDLEELRAIVADIRKDDRRAADVIERMRALIKRGSVEIQPLALDEVVRDAISLVRTEAVARDVALECILPPQLPLVSGDRVHISQVLLNLLINGMQAMQACPVGARRMVIEARTTPAGNVEVAVRDSGPGIPDERIEKVFDPFFTTKTAGMGMGLAVSRTIVEAHGGRIWAERSVAGTGATLRFTLRRAWDERPANAACHDPTSQHKPALLPSLSSAYREGG
jgi:signal transduction histidine kinase